MIRNAEGAVRGSPGRAAFVKIGAFSHINESLLEALQREFSDCQFDVVDVWDSYLARDLANLYACFREYGRQILIGRKNLTRVHASHGLHLQEDSEIVGPTARD